MAYRKDSGASGLAASVLPTVIAVVLACAGWFTADMHSRLSDLEKHHAQAAAALARISETGRNLEIALRDLSYEFHASRAPIVGIGVAPRAPVVGGSTP